ncbi:MAG: hypothetical protein VX589_13095 [Myxococcota bacterium]|nr:hypothetical protein [Myxococcota bacterium]
MAHRTQQTTGRLSDGTLRLTWLWLCFWFGLVGCQGDLKGEIEGVYRIDMDRIRADLSEGRSDVQAGQWMLTLGTKMLRPVQYGIKDGACWRGVAGARQKLDCRFVRVDKKKVVVFRSEDNVGRIQFLRANRTDTGVDLEIDGRTLPLIRIDSTGTP